LGQWTASALAVSARLSLAALWMPGGCWVLTLAEQEAVWLGYNRETEINNAAKSICRDLITLHREGTMLFGLYRIFTLPFDLLLNLNNKPRYRKLPSLKEKQDRQIR
jgi:hypothetical protein